MGKNRNKHKEPEKPLEGENTEIAEVAPISEAISDLFEQRSTNNFEEAATKIEEAGGDASAPTEPVTTKVRGVLPDALGNNVKGQRVCSNCGVLEAEMLKKNPRYSLCKGVCVNCYGKLHRKSAKPEDMTVEQIKAKIDHFQDLLTKKLGEQGRVEESAIENTITTIDDDSVVTLGASEDTTTTH